jgi:hypothetical protein
MSNAALTLIRCKLFAQKPLIYPPSPRRALVSCQHICSKRHRLDLLQAFGQGTVIEPLASSLLALHCNEADLAQVTPE